MVSMKPCTAGPNARRRITSRLTRLIPILTLMRAAGVSRRTRATNGSSRALPPNPRLTNSQPRVMAASAGQVALGLAASEPWLIELPWCSHTLSASNGTGAMGASVRSAISSVASLKGSQSSTFFTRAGKPAKRTVPGRPGAVCVAPVARLMVQTLPPSTLACAARMPSISKS
jgi:hypothetical protein